MITGTPCTRTDYHAHTCHRCGRAFDPAPAPCPVHSLYTCEDACTDCLDVPETVMLTGMATNGENVAVTVTATGWYRVTLAGETMLDSTNKAWALDVARELIDGI